MKLLPSLKQKKRYIAFEIISDKVFTASPVETAVMVAIKDFIGELGIAKSAPQFVKEQYHNNRFVLKVNHHFVKEIIAALMLITHLGTAKVIVKSIITSGILKKVNE